jgi:glycylpeptide N-tetradecanoyltransferase
MSSRNPEEEAGLIQREPTMEDQARVAQIIEMLKKNQLGSNVPASHAFWDTQPMFIQDKVNAAEKNEGAEEFTLHAPIVPNKPASEIRQEPYNMPRGFSWSDIDIMDQTERNQVYDLLNRNYVEDDDQMFRFDYSLDFLEWALTPPGYSKHLHLGVRSDSTKKLVAFISAVPASVRAYDKTFPSVEINFLCVHKKLRSKRLAPVLIKEITRRVNLTGVFQAVYTAGVTLPGPVSSCRYYHRTLNAKKLVDVGFTRIPPRMTMARMTKMYKVPSTPSTPGLRPMELKDCKSACELLRKNHLDQFKLVVNYDLEDFTHWFMPRKGVISTFVATKEVDGEEVVTDMISYYHLHSTIIGNPNYTHLRAAYSFFNVATSVDLDVLMTDALIMAKEEEMDVFNALEQMHNGSFFEKLKFGKGDGNLQYYLYNWCCPTLKSEDVGIVLL